MKQNHLTVLTAFCLFFLATITLQAQATAIKMGDIIEKNLQVGEVHQYEVQLDKNRFCVLDLFQDGIDIMITAFDEQGKKIADFDSPNGAFGSEPIQLISDDATSFRLDVKALNENGEPGKYTLQILKNIEK